MNIVNVDVNSKDGVFYVVPIADTHIGSMEFNEQALQNVIDFVLENDNAYCFLNGDILDNATRSSVASVFDSALTPSASLGKAFEMFKPLAEKEKILFFNGGNHEMRDKETDVTPSSVLAFNLGLAKRYTDGATYCFLSSSVGDNRTQRGTFTLFSYHGKGGGISLGGKLTQVSKMADIIDSDVYVMSHVHETTLAYRDFFKPDLNNKKVDKRTRLFVSTNAFMNYGGYAEQKALPVGSIVIPKIVFKLKRVHYGRTKEKVEKVVGCETSTIF